MCQNCQNPHCARNGCREITKIINLSTIMPDYEGTFPAEEYLKRPQTGQGSTNVPQGEGYDIQKDAAMLEALQHMQQKVRQKPEQPTATEMFERLTETELQIFRIEANRSKELLQSRRKEYDGVDFEASLQVAMVRMGIQKMDILLDIIEKRISELKQTQP